MATPMSASQFIAALKKEGVKVSERYSGWRNHERDDETGKAFGPVNGVVIHHTAGSNSLSLCYNGSAALPGPLCHTHLAKNGTATMISAGRANHGGTFAANAFNAMLNESKTHPPPDASEPIDANDRTYGLEIENLGNGKDPYPAVQYDQAVRWAAAICRFHGWTEHSVIGHKEGTRRKIDPSFNMNTFRADVAKRLKGSTTPPKPDPKPVPRKLEWLPVAGYMPELRHGDKNWHVDWMQRNLNRFLSPNIKVDGVYGDATAAAVHKFYKQELNYTTTTNGKVFGAGGWQRVLSLAKDDKGNSY